VPEQSWEVSIHDLVGKTLTGWDEIRQALFGVEQLPEEQRNNEIKVEVYEYDNDSSVKIGFNTLKELDDYEESNCFWCEQLSTQREKPVKQSSILYLYWVGESNRGLNSHGLTSLNLSCRLNSQLSNKKKLQSIIVGGF
jgi:hypothetical protein